MIYDLFWLFMASIIFNEQVRGISTDDAIAVTIVCGSVRLVCSQGTDRDRAVHRDTGQVEDGDIHSLITYITSYPRYVTVKFVL